MQVSILYATVIPKMYIKELIHDEQRDEQQNLRETMPRMEEAERKREEENQKRNAVTKKEKKKSPPSHKKRFGGRSQKEKDDLDVVKHKPL